MVENYIDALECHEILTTSRLILRKFKEEDAEAVLEYGSDAETVKYLVWDGVQTLEEAKQSILDYYLSRPGIYAITLKEGAKCIGCIDLRINEEHEKSGFGYVLNRQYWGNGYMTEALQAVLALCFDRLELNRVEDGHYIENGSSGRVMAKCGMTREGMAKQQVKIKGVFRDVVHYGITRDEWMLST
ncbi:MAG: GNAT family N-acetyltransferase [Oscillospiraceae bacterium]|nr:GNAT family N-acetyltransferase [Oscillospiraceae bacterium]